MTNPREFDRNPDPVYRHFHYKTHAETFVNYYEWTFILIGIMMEDCRQVWGGVGVAEKG